jgi:HAAS domain-containing protein
MTALETWLARATRQLSADSAAQVRAEIAQHFESSREDALASGVAGDEADRAAIAALGDPKSANCQYREVLLTRSEARLLRSSACEAKFFSATPLRKRLLILVPAAAATCAAAAYGLATITAPFAIPFTASASANATASLIARIAIIAAILTAVVFALPLLPIYTPGRARVYRAAKWLTVLVICIVVCERNLANSSWLLLNCFSFIAWIEAKRMSLRRKIPAANWPKHLYL